MEHTTPKSTGPGTYPRVVVRYVAGFYGNLSFHYTDSPGPASPEAVVVPAPGPRPGEPVSPTLRAQIVQATIDHARRTRFRCCAVFGRDDAVYCEPDGSAEAHHQPPGPVTVTSVVRFGPSGG